jgi:hypothetical protein
MTGVSLTMFGRRKIPRIRAMRTTARIETTNEDIVEFLRCC